MSNCVRNFFFPAACFLPFLALSQAGSPYSWYGPGELQSPWFAHSLAKGGTWGGYSPGGIRFMNPASYSDLTLTTFEAGASAKGLLLRSDTAEVRDADASLSYLSFAFPLSSGWAASAGLMPYSTVSYDMEETTYDPPAGSITYRYSGSGGLYRFYGGTGMRLFPGRPDTGKHALSAGLNLSYIFGTVTKSASSEPQDTAGSFNARKTYTSHLNGFQWDASAQYAGRFAKDFFATASARAAFGASLRSSRDLLWVRYETNGTSEKIKDTVSLASGEKSSMTLPASVGGGVSFGKRSGQAPPRWSLCADVTYTDWSRYRYLGEADSLEALIRYSLGGEVIPDPKSLHNYWKQVRYRAGMYYSAGYISLQNADFSSFGITFGVGLPVRKTASVVHFSMELGRRGAPGSTLVQEKYILGALGFTFSDKWFVRRKID